MPDKKISELESTVSFDGATDILPIVDTSADVTKKITINNLLQGQVSSVSLGTNAPRTDGYTADEGSIGEALDGSRWLKVDAGDTDWEQIFLTESGAFSANIELAQASGVTVPANVLGSRDGFPVFGDGEAVGGNKIALERSQNVPPKYLSDAAYGFYTLSNGYQFSTTMKQGGFSNTTEYAEFNYPDYPTINSARIIYVGPIANPATDTIYIWPDAPFKIATEKNRFLFQPIEVALFSNSVVKISENTFGAASNLKYCNFPEGLEFIGASAFPNLTNFAEPFVAPTTLKQINASAFAGSSVPSVSFNSGFNYTAEGSFENNNISSVDLGETIKLIGTDAFKDNNIVGNLVIPDSLGSASTTPSGTGFMSRSGIEDGAFENNTGLGDVYANIGSSHFVSGALRNAGTGALYVTSGYIASYGGTGASWGTKTVAEWTNYPTIPN